jgi:hypothetical protein
MFVKLLTLALGVAAIMPMAHAQDGKPDEATVQHLMKDPAALKAALAHCNPNSLTMDRDCAAGNEARRRLFFGDTPTYTPQKVDIFPSEGKTSPKPAQPAPKPPGSGQP